MKAFVIYTSGADELKHFGILGMKWGVRRYQNKDGTLTALGKKRYGNDSITTQPSKVVKNERAEKKPRTREEMFPDNRFKDIKVGGKDVQIMYDKDVSAETLKKIETIAPKLNRLDPEFREIIAKDLYDGGRDFYGMKSQVSREAFKNGLVMELVFGHGDYGCDVDYYDTSGYMGSHSINLECDWDLKHMPKYASVNG